MTFGKHQRADRRDCKHCNQVRSWIFSKFKGPNRIYVDEYGRPWDGSHCPQCVMLREPKVKRQPAGRTGEV